MLRKLGLAAFVLALFTIVNAESQTGSSYPSASGNGSYHSNFGTPMPVCGNSICEVGENSACSDCTQAVAGSQSSNIAQAQKPSTASLQIGAQVQPATALVAAITTPQTNNIPLQIPESIEPKVIPPRKNTLNGITLKPPEPPKYVDGMRIPDTEKCSDTDGGFFTVTRGTVAIGNLVLSDSSIMHEGFGGVIEYFCTDEKPEGFDSKIITCPGKSSNGECEPFTPRQRQEARKRGNICEQLKSVSPGSVVKRQSYSLALLNTHNKGKQLESTRKLLGFVERSARQSAKPLVTKQEEKELLTISESRKKEMLELAEKNPSAFLFNVVPERQQSKLPFEVRKNLEKSVDVQGYLEAWEKPHLKDKKPAGGYDYYLNAGEKKIYRLMVAGDSGIDSDSGPRARVLGTRIGNYIVVESSDKISVSLARNSAKNLGVQRIAVILTKPVGGKNPLNPDLESAMQKNNLYYQENSFGQTSVEWDVFGPYELSENTFAGQNPLDDSIEIIKVADNDIDYTKYSFILSIDERNRGIATLGRISSQTNEGTRELGVAFMYPQNDQQVQYWTPAITHEIGHAFGARHSGVVACGNKPIDVPEKCKVHEYGDGFDIMGSLYLGGHFSPIHKEKIWWMGTRVKQVNSDGVYKVYAHKTREKEPVAVKIVSKFGDYYIEYRSRAETGFGSELLKNTQNNASVIIRFKVNDLHYNRTPQGNNIPAGTSMLIPMHNTDEESSYVNNLALMPGETFVGMDGVVITTNSLNDESATISVNCLRAQLM